MSSASVATLSLEPNSSHPYEQTSGRHSPIHRLGMWWFLGSEVAVFGGLIVTYLLFRWRHPEWAVQASHTLTWVGITNTVILLTSSLLMVLVHHYTMGGGGAGRSLEERARLGARYMFFVILLGITFLGFKSYEYTHEIHAGYTPARSLFWGFYFLMTGLHGLHVIGGIIANGIGWVGFLKKRDLQRSEPLGIYWHFVDVIWIYLFPLLYLGSSGGTP